MHFPGFDKLSAGKNTNATFLSRRKYNDPFPNSKRMLWEIYKYIWHEKETTNSHAHVEPIS